MEPPLPAQHGRPLPESGEIAPRSPKPVRQRAQDWARSVPIATHYPNDGKRVYDPTGLRATLILLASWCSERTGFYPEPILEDFYSKKSREWKPGALTQLNININVWRLRMSALRRLKFVSPYLQGNQHRRHIYILHVQAVRAEFQQELPIESRTSKHGLRGGLVTEGHEPKPTEPSTAPSRAHVQGTEREHSHEAASPQNEIEGGEHTSPVLTSFIRNLVEACNLQLQIQPPIDATYVLRLLHGVPVVRSIPADLTQKVVQHVDRVQPATPERYIAEVVRNELTGRVPKRTYGASPSRQGRPPSRSKSDGGRGGEYTKSGYKRTSQL